MGSWATVSEQPLAEEPPHDVLAAEMFGVPAPDPTIHHAPVVLPADLTGVDEPRDVLAAEEFAMPAAPAHPEGAAAGGRRSARKAAVAGVAVAFGLVVALRALRRR